MNTKIIKNWANTPGQEDAMALEHDWIWREMIGAIDYMSLWAHSRLSLQRARMSAVFVSDAKHNKFSHNPGPDETRAGAIVFFDPFSNF